MHLGNGARYENVTRRISSKCILIAPNNTSEMLSVALDYRIQRDKPRLLIAIEGLLDAAMQGIDVDVWKRYDINIAQLPCFVNRMAEQNQGL